MSEKLTDFQKAMRKRTKEATRRTEDYGSAYPKGTIPKRYEVAGKGLERKVEKWLKGDKRTLWYEAQVGCSRSYCTPACEGVRLFNGAHWDRKRRLCRNEGGTADFVMKYDGAIIVVEVKRSDLSGATPQSKRARASAVDQLQSYLHADVYRLDGYWDDAYADYGLLVWESAKGERGVYTVSEHTDSVKKWRHAKRWIQYKKKGKT